MSGWRLARSLETLRAEVNTIAPGRSKASDGTIGDAAHQSGASDHNPNSAGVVCAIDLTHDPDHGADMHRIAEHIRTRRHPALKYVIWNRRIASASSGWAWRTYTGSNPHTKHMHVSVGTGPDGKSAGPYDNTSPWGLAEEEDMSEVVKGIQEAVKAAGYDPGPIDGEWGPKTQAGLTAALRSTGPAGPKGPQGPAGPAGPPGALPARLTITGEVTASIPGQASA